MVFLLEVTCEDTKRKVACIVGDFRILNYVRMQKIHGVGDMFIFDFFFTHANLKSRDNKVECVTTVSLVGIFLLGRFHPFKGHEGP